jgi:hypothetical protein
MTGMTDAFAVWPNPSFGHGALEGLKIRPILGPDAGRLTAMTGVTSKQN